MRRIILRVPELAAAAPPARVDLSGREAHHARDVLRLAPGRAVQVAAGAGKLWEGIVETVTASGVTIALTGAFAPAASPMPVTLAVALVKKGFDDLVRQAVELGVARLVPLRTARTVAGLAAKRERWLAIAGEAEKQSGRAGSLVLGEIVSLPAFAAREAGPGRFVADPEARESLLAAAGAVEPPYAIAIGPEGGLTDEEAALLAGAGFRPASLGAAILRTETAALAAAALLGELARGRPRSPA